MIDFERKLSAVADSIKMNGIGDKLESIVEETKASFIPDGVRSLSEDELDMVAGGISSGNGLFRDPDDGLKKPDFKSGNRMLRKKSFCLKEDI